MQNENNQNNCIVHIQSYFDICSMSWVNKIKNVHAGNLRFISDNYAFYKTPSLASEFKQC